MAFTCEQFSNSTSTQVAIGIDDIDTTLEVDSFDGFPTSTPYRIMIDDEIMLVTGGAGTTTWTITRGEEDSMPTSHDVGANVANVFTTTSFASFAECMAMTDIRSELPSPANQGRLYLTKSPGWYFFQDQEVEWSAWGPVYELFEPNNDEFTWVNQNDTFVEAAGTITDNGGIYLETPPLSMISIVSGIYVDEVRLKVQDVDFVSPTSPPYTLTIGFVPNLEETDQTSCGLIVRDNTIGNFIFFRLMYDTNATTKRNLILSVDKYTNEQFFDSNYITLSAGTLIGSIVWFRMEDDNNDLIWSISNDGKNFMEIITQSRTDFLANPNQIGFAVNTNNVTALAGMTLVSWNKE